MCNTCVIRPKRGAEGLAQRVNEAMAHEIRDPAADWLWAAGLWEEHPEYGRCHTMVTTAASPLIL